MTTWSMIFDIFIGFLTFKYVLKEQGMVKLKSGNENMVHS